MKNLGKRILVIEDDFAMQAMIKEFLEMQGFTTIAFRIAKEALEQMDNGFTCDLVITDMNMPQMNGLEVINEIHRFYPNLPVIMITAFGTDRVESAARQAGAQGFLNKPFKLSDLKEVVQTILSKAS